MQTGWACGMLRTAAMVRPWWECWVSSSSVVTAHRELLLSYSLCLPCSAPQPQFMRPGYVQGIANPSKGPSRIRGSQDYTETVSLTLTQFCFLPWGSKQKWKWYMNELPCLSKNRRLDFLLKNKTTEKKTNPHPPQLALCVWWWEHLRSTLRWTSSIRLSACAHSPPTYLIAPSLNQHSVPPIPQPNNHPSTVSW